MKKSNVACFGLGVDQLFFLKKLRNDYNIIGFDHNLNCAGKKYVKELYSTNFKKKNQILNILKKKKIIKIFSFATEAPIALIGFLNKKLNLRGSMENISLSICNKYKMRLKLKDKVLQPKFYSSITKKNLKKKIIIKPLTGSASENISFMKNNNFVKNKNKFYFEEFILNGDMYAIDGFCINGQFKHVSLSKKIKSTANIFLDKIIKFNIKNNKILKLAINCAQKHCEILNVVNEPIHFEFLLKKNKIYSIDFHIRGPGSGIYSYLMNNITDPNIYIIQKNLDKNILFKLKKNFYTYVYFINTTNELNYFKNNFRNKNIKYTLKMWKQIKKFKNTKNTTRDRLGVIYFIFNRQKSFAKGARYLDSFFKGNI